MLNHLHRLNRSLPKLINFNFATISSFRIVPKGTILLQYCIKDYTTSIDFSSINEALFYAKSNSKISFFIPSIELYNY